MGTIPILTTCVLIGLISFVKSSNYDDEANLQDVMFSNYSKNIRPRNNIDNKTDIQLLIELTSISGMDEVQEVLTSVSLVFVSWTDNKLTWNSHDHGDITSITVDKSLIWSPAIIVANSVTNLESVGLAGLPVHVSANGNVLLEFGQLMHTKCDMDIRYYPFDTQQCYLNIMPIGMRYDQVNLSTYRLETHFYSPNNAWILLSTKSTISYLGPHPYVKYTMTLERRYAFYILNLFSPVLIMAFLNSMVFVLPADSGERVGYAITCLLSLSVYMTYASDNLPRSSKPLPIITVVLISGFIISAFISVMTVIGLRFHMHENSNSPPTILLKLLGLSPVTCARKGKIDALSDSNEDEKAWPEVVSKEISWDDVANKFDRLCFIVSNVCSFLLAFLYFFIVRILNA